MGKNNRVKKTRKKPPAIPEQLIKVELKRIKRQNQEAIYQKFEKTIYPIALEEAFLRLIYLTLMTARDKFGFGKDRLTRLADGILNNYECVADQLVTLQDMSDEIYRITGHRFELSSEDLMKRAKEAVGEKRMINSKQKGAAGEREWAKFCRKHGYRDCRRTAQYCGNTGDASDVVGLIGIHQEVKRVERLNLENAMEQASRDSAALDNLPIVAHRKNRGEWMVTMWAEDWFALYDAWSKENYGKQNEDDTEPVPAP